MTAQRKRQNELHRVCPPEWHAFFCNCTETELRPDARDNWSSKTGASEEGTVSTRPSLSPHGGCDRSASPPLAAILPGNSPSCPCYRLPQRALRAWSPLRWSYADNFGVLARGENCINDHLARLIAGVQKAGLDVHDISLASGVPMFSDMKCAQPTRIAVERANGYHVSVQSRGRSRRAVAFAGGRWSSSMVTSPSW